MPRKKVRTRDNQIGEKVVTAIGLLGGEATMAEVEKELGRVVSNSLYTRLIRDGQIDRVRPGTYKLVSMNTVPVPTTNGVKSTNDRLASVMEILFPEVYPPTDQLLDWLDLTREVMTH